MDHMDSMEKQELLDLPVQQWWSEIESDRELLAYYQVCRGLKQNGPEADLWDRFQKRLAGRDASRRRITAWTVGSAMAAGLLILGLVLIPPVPQKQYQYLSSGSTDVLEVYTQVLNDHNGEEETALDYMYEIVNTL